MLLCLQIAFYWEGNDPKDEGKITYAELHRDVCKFANVLKTKGGVRKGDRVAIYMPMITELVVAMLACARYQTSSCIFYENRVQAQQIPTNNVKSQSFLLEDTL